MEIFLGEFLGTALLILLGNGSVANVLLQRSKGLAGGWIVITSGWAFAVALGVYCSAWLSGAHLNPAVTLGFAFLGKTAWSVVPLYWLAQWLGAMAGAFLVWISYYPHWALTEDPTTKLLCFCTKPAIRHTWGNFAVEVIGTAVLLLGVLVIYEPHNKMTPALGPYMVGIVVFAIGLSLGGPTGYAINPTRDLGPRCMHALLPIAGKGPSEWNYAWIPIVAPCIGGLIGAWIYKLMFS